MQIFLPVGSRSTVFTPHSRLLALYPEHLRPSFVYIHNEDEIARLEIPAWIASNKDMLDTALRMVYDQCSKRKWLPYSSFRST